MAVAEAYYASGGKKDGSTSIEQISSVYGAQAVVVSIDPRRVYVKDPKDVKHACVRAGKKGPNGEEWAWYQCTVNGGRAGRDLGAMELAKAVEALGAGEILLNCIDEDGQGNGFDLELVRQVSSAVRIPVIASSGAGKPSHFTDVFNGTGCSAALAAGIFHRKEARRRHLWGGLCAWGFRPGHRVCSSSNHFLLCSLAPVCVRERHSACSLPPGVYSGGKGAHGEQRAADAADRGGGGGGVG